MAEVAIRVQVSGATAAAQELSNLQQTTQRLASTTRQAFAQPREALRSFSVALSSVGTVLRLTGGASGELADKLERMSIAVFSATAALSALRGVAASLPVVIAAVQAALAALTIGVAALASPVGLLLIALAGLPLLLKDLGVEFKRTDTAARELGRNLPPVSAALDLLAKSGFDAAKGLSEATRYMLTFTRLAPEVRNQILGIGLATKQMFGGLNVPSFQEFTRLLDDLKDKPKAGAAGVDRLSEAFGNATREAELLARINETSNEALAGQLEVIYERFVRIPGAARRIKFELLELRARIVELRGGAEDFTEALNDLLRKQMQALVARGPLEARGAVMRENELAVIRQQIEATDQAARESADLIDRFNRQAIDAIEERMEAQRREAEQVRQAIQDTLELRQIEVDIAGQLFEMGQVGADAVIQARQKLIEYITALEQTAMGTEAARLALTKLGLEGANAATLAQEKLRLAAGNIVDAFRAVSDEIKDTTFNWVDSVRSAAQEMQQSMSDIFFDTMRGNLRSLGDLFDAVLSALQRQLANWLASQVVQQFTGLFGGFSLFGAGGGGGGGTLGVRPMQTGGRFVVNRPTLMTVGETGTEQIDVRPLAVGPRPGRPGEPQAASLVIQMPIHINTLDPASMAAWLAQNQDMMQDYMADSLAAALQRNHPLARRLQLG